MSTCGVWRIAVAWDPVLGENGIFMKKAPITGIAILDGLRLAEVLLRKGYKGHGRGRRSSNRNAGRTGAYRTPESWFIGKALGVE
jgi:hypothetical protein